MGCCQCAIPNREDCQKRNSFEQKDVRDADEYADAFDQPETRPCCPQDCRVRLLRGKGFHPAMWGTDKAVRAHLCLPSIREPIPHRPAPGVLTRVNEVTSEKPVGNFPEMQHILQIASVAVACFRARQGRAPLLPTCDQNESGP